MIVEKVDVRGKKSFDNFCEDYFGSIINVAKC